jgi:hypothetical protein
MTVSEWMKLNTGDLVYAYDDPRHLGRVESIWNSSKVRIRWYDNGWFEWRDLPDVRRIKTDREYKTWEAAFN